MRRFDGEDEPRATPEPARRRGFGARPQFGALVTASLIVVVGLPAALIAILDSQPPPPPAPVPVAGRPAAPAADSAEVIAPQEPEPVQASGPPAPPATMPAPNRRMALSDAADDGLVSSTPVASYAPAPPPPSVAPAAPPPFSPSAAPARSEREAVAAAESDAGESQIVVTGSTVAVAQQGLDQQLRDGRGRSNAAPRKAMEPATAPKWVLSDPAFRGFLTQLQNAVRSNDRTAVIRLVRLPLRVNFATGAKTYRGGRSVLAEYDRIFTPAVRSSILSQRFENLFARDQGVMIGNGAVWFDHVCRNPSCTPPGPVRIHAINP